IREQDEPLVHPLVLGLDRLFDLEQELRLRPHVVDRDDQRAGRLVCLVRKRTTRAGAALDQDLVPALRELACACRRQRDAVLVALDLLRDTDAHSASTLAFRRRRDPSDAELAQTSARFTAIVDAEGGG